ncbi:hypothetical protein [Marinobacter sp. C1S70]
MDLLPVIRGRELSCRDMEDLGASFQEYRVLKID